jgi:hypothetical protein
MMHRTALGVRLGLAPCCVVALLVCACVSPRVGPEESFSAIQTTIRDENYVVTYELLGNEARRAWEDYVRVAYQHSEIHCHILKIGRFGATPGLDSQTAGLRARFGLEPAEILQRTPEELFAVYLARDSRARRRVENAETIRVIGVGEGEAKLELELPDGRRKLLRMRRSAGAWHLATPLWGDLWPTLW